jgi:hypothetical protein
MMNSEFHTKEANDILKNSISSETFSIFDFFLINSKLKNKVQLQKHTLKDNSIVYEMLDHIYLDKDIVTDEFIPIVLINQEQNLIIETAWNSEKLKLK